MKALSIRQPWAWLILNGGKDIENRTWPTKVRGRILIHAAKGLTRDEWADAWEFASGSGASPKAVEARINFDNIQRGGIVGSVEIVDCVDRSDSRWFMGRYGFMLRDPRPLPFVPFKGQLGFFDVPDSLLDGPFNEPGFEVQSPCGRAWFVPLEAVGRDYAEFLIEADGISAEDAADKVKNNQSFLPTWFDEQCTTWVDVERLGRLIQQSTLFKSKSALDNARGHHVQDYTARLTA